MVQKNPASTNLLNAPPGNNKFRAGVKNLPAVIAACTIGDNLYRYLQRLFWQCLVEYVNLELFKRVTIHGFGKVISIQLQNQTRYPQIKLS